MELAENGNNNSNVDSVYLLIVSGQTYTSEEKSNVINQINSGLNQIGSPILERRDELIEVLNRTPLDTNLIDQEHCTEYKNGADFDFQLLVNAKSSSFRVALDDFLRSTFNRKYLILTTTDHNSYGDIHLQDCAFTYDDFVILANTHEDQKKQKSSPTHKTTAFVNSKIIDANKNWKNLEKSLNIELVPLKSTKAEAHTEIASHLSKFLSEDSLFQRQLLEQTKSKLTGTLNVQRPSLYIFPARGGDSAYFNISGYSMLINAGYERLRPCFWKFLTMLKEIDSLLITHTDADSLGGLPALLNAYQANENFTPRIRSVLANLIQSKHQNETVEAAAAAAAAEVDVSDVDTIVDSLHRLKIKLTPLVKSVDNLAARVSNPSKYEQIKLYHKIGHGSLDLYVLSPFGNSADYKEFVSQQQNRFSKNVHQKSALGVHNYFRQVPLAHVCSAVCLIVWLPDVHADRAHSSEANALRLLFTGDAPQSVIFNALDKVKDLDVLTSQVYRKKVPVESSSSAVESKSQSNGTSKKSHGASSNGTDKLSNGINHANKQSKPPISNGHHESSSTTTTTATSTTTSTSTTTKSRTSVAAKSLSTNEASSTSSSSSSAAAASAPTTKPPVMPASARPPKSSTSNLHAASATTSTSTSSTTSTADNHSKRPLKSTSTANLKTVNTTAATNGESKAAKNAESLPKAAAAAAASAKPVAKTTSDLKATTNTTKPPRVSTNGNTASTKSGAAAAAVTDNKTHNHNKKETKTLSVSVGKSKSNPADADKATKADDASKKDESKIIRKRQPTAAAKSSSSSSSSSSSAAAGVTPVVAAATVVPSTSSHADFVQSEQVTVEDVVMVVPESNAEPEMVAEQIAEAILEPVEPEAEPVEPVEQQVEVVEQIEQIEQIEQVEPIEQVEQNELVEQNEQVESVESVEPVESVEQTEQIAPAEPVIDEVITHTESVEVVATETLESHETVEIETTAAASIVEPANETDPSEFVLQTDEQQEQEEQQSAVYIEESLGKSIDALPEQSHIEQHHHHHHQIQQQQSTDDLDSIPPPNLSPVKKDSSSASNNNTIDGGEHQVVQNASLNNGSATSQMNGGHGGGNGYNQDIMTTSFIEDSSNPDSNPFNGSGLTLAAPQNGSRKLDLNVSENDLNKTHQLSDEENENEQENGDENLEEGEIPVTPSSSQVESINGLKQQQQQLKTPIMDGDVLASVLESMCIGSHHHHHQENGSSQPTTPNMFMAGGGGGGNQDQNSWNLLQLPKPVNPNDVGMVTSAAAAAAASSSNGNVPVVVEKKQTAPNGKKLNNPSSPLNDATNKISAIVNRTSQSKPQAKSAPIHPVYVELSYVPAHANIHYSDIDFFKRVRSRHYVFSCEELDISQLNALSDAKETWDDKSMLVTVIPTYESEAVSRWFDQNEEKLQRLRIDISPAANSGTVTLDEIPDMTCKALKVLL
jgi:hypothetical protein